MNTYPECPGATICDPLDCVIPTLPGCDVHNFPALPNCSGQGAATLPLLGGSAELAVVMELIPSTPPGVLEAGSHVVMRLTYGIPLAAQPGEEFLISVRKGSAVAEPSVIDAAGAEILCCDLLANSGLVTVVAGCTAPELLTCQPGLGGVQLDWSNPQDFTSIDIQRNGVVIATLPNGTETSFLDTTPELGTQEYVVIGQCPDPPGGGPQSSTSCSVEVLRLSADDDVLASGGSTTVPIRFQHTAGLVGGVQFGLRHDSTRLNPTGMTLSGDVTIAAGFEQLTIDSMNSGLTYVAVFEEDVAPLTIPVSGPGPRVVEIEYEVVAGAASGPTSITFTDTLGSPFPISPELSLRDPMTGVFAPVTPITDDGSVLIGGKFIRGDCNQDNSITLVDAIACLQLLFTPGAIPDPMCDDQQDVNDDGMRTISDAIALLNYLFGGAGPLAAPFPPTNPATCELDPTPDALDCAVDPAYCP